MKSSAIASAALLAAALFSAPLYAEEVKIPTQTVDAALRAKLPKEILDAGEIISVNNGSFPPYEIVTDTRSLTGASADLAHAIGEVLGIKMRHESVSGLSGMLAGIKSGRYQMGIGPTGDFPDRQAANDFVDFVQEYVVFAVQKGNPKNIQGLDDTCGARIAVMSGGSAERVIKQQAEACTKAGKPAIEVQSFADQPTSILAVRSKRSDAFFSSQAPLTYFIQQSNGELELAAVGKSNGFEDLFQGTVVPKGSVLGEVILEAYKKLFANGTYAIIMKKWGLENNMLKAPGINLAGKKQ
ncbi:ABC transporter substrate-binding protein [Microvirga terricola]|uniref:ABC transporter substrate-binding protein n=1 Tax=Microvirga terricola TaxID=2719797 RepID=A0ABX0VEA3_9HYPH|nr:ABC transporter substrate-binding protein [Microvirga terricola]NIX76666.1 ABC transporter substrate-binding protein [Microvirga terricola]